MGPGQSVGAIARDGTREWCLLRTPHPTHTHTATRTCHMPMAHAMPVPNQEPCACGFSFPLVNGHECGTDRWYRTGTSTGREVGTTAVPWYIQRHVRMYMYQW